MRYRYIKFKTRGRSLLFAGLFAGGLLTQSVPGWCDARYNWEALLNTRRIAIVAPFFCTIKPPVSPSLSAPAAKPKARIVWPALPASPSHPSRPSIQPKPASSRQTATDTTRKQTQNTPIRLAPVQLDPVSPSPNAAHSQKQPDSTAITAADTSFHAKTLQSLAATMQAALPQSIAAGRVYQVIPEGESAAALRALRWQPRDLFVRHGEPADGKFPRAGCETYPEIGAAPACGWRSRRRDA